MRKNLLAWQWQDYPNFHHSRANLVLHCATVPLFWLGSAGLLPMLLTGRWLAALGCVGAMVIALAAQGRGHKLEANPTIPMAGPVDFVTRFFAEQWVTFPRFFLSKLR